MKNTLYTLALLVSFSSFGQEDIKQGLVTKYLESGEVISKTNYVDGKRQGETIIYYVSVFGLCSYIIILCQNPANH